MELARYRLEFSETANFSASSQAACVYVKGTGGSLLCLFSLRVVVTQDRRAFPKLGVAFQRNFIKPSFQHQRHTVSFCSRGDIEFDSNIVFLLPFRKLHCLIITIY